MPDPLPEELRRALDSTAARRGHFGEPLTYFFETDSTNDVAIALADAGAPEGATVVASAQTAGRGRLGRRWYSPSGAGLYVSVVCRSSRAAPLLTLAGGVAVAVGIRQAVGLPVEIKWPNDVVITDRRAPGGRRKLAGILAEGTSGPGGFQHVVLGFGINVRSAAYPESIATAATSLEAELGRDVDAGMVLAESLVALNDAVGELEAGNPQRVLARWRALAPSSRSACVEWSTNGVTWRGAAAGIDDGGALLVRVADRVERIVAGELKWL